MQSSQGKGGTYTELEERKSGKGNEEEKPLVTPEGQNETISEQEKEEKLEDDFDREYWVAVSRT